jgi:subtilisin family serine protease
VQKLDQSRSPSPLRLIRALDLMEVTSGDPLIRVGIIDGPIDGTHPALSRMRTIVAKGDNSVLCTFKNSIACIHGTFIAGILGATRGYAAPAMCPDCTFIVRPIFLEGASTSLDFPSTSPNKLADAIIDVVDAGAKIVNLSAGLASSSLKRYPSLITAYDYARSRGVLVVMAAGNQGYMGYLSLLSDPWIIPVASCNEEGKFYSESNFGPTIGRRGLMAPGINIISSIPGDRQYAQMSGTSTAAAFVTGALALLWSAFPKANPSLLRNALFAHVNGDRYKGIIPRILNVEMARKYLSVRY